MNGVSGKLSHVVVLVISVLVINKRQYSALFQCYLFSHKNTFMHDALQIQQYFYTLAGTITDQVCFTHGSTEWLSHSFKTHMNKMAPAGPNHYIFGDHFYSKNARKLKSHVFLHFNARKQMMSSFYLNWTKFTRNCEFVPQFGFPGTHSWNKMMMLDVFKHEKGGVHGI